MKLNFIPLIATSTLVLMSFGSIEAHGKHPEVKIHTFENGETWKNCSFMIHPSLTRQEFKRFTSEAGNIIYFQPLNGASSLGRHRFDINVAMSKTPIDQSSGAWNNTFAHPITDTLVEDPHWLGDKIALPNIRFGYGITDNLDAGLYFTKDPMANYGFVGVSLKYSKEILPGKQVYAAGRASYAQLFGPADLGLNTSSIDGLLSKKWSIFEPYIGGSVSLNHAWESTAKVDIKSIYTCTPRALVGLNAKYKFASAGVEYDLSKVNTLAFRFGVSF